MSGVDPGHLRAALEAGELAKAGRHAEALVVIQRAQRRGSSAILDNAGAIAQSSLGQLDAALFLARRAAAEVPGSSDIQMTLGNVLMLRGELEAAAAALERALTIRPQNGGARTTLATVHRLRRRASDATNVLREAKEGQRDAAGDLAMIAALADLGRIEEAWALGEESVARFGDDPKLLAAHASTSNHVPGLTARASEAAHERFGIAMEQRSPTPPRPVVRRPEPERELRVGFVSPDFRRHSVAYFMEPLLRNLRGMHVTLYALHGRDDDVSRRLAGLVQQWRPVAWLDAKATAAQIVKDQIDILVDLAGHTQDNRIGVFHLRPAPVQATYLGYPNITGLHAMDARIVDSITDPLGAEADRASEKLVRMESPFVCFGPEAEAPEPSLTEHAGVCFGSFNSTKKLNEDVIETWAAILVRVPGSRLLLKAPALDDPALCAELARRFGDRGVDAHRVELRGHAKDTADHLRAYAEVDIALDPFPYNGTTTTCEALWQGVPVVTLAGERHAARVGASLLGSVGLGELVAESRERYVALACELAASPARVAAWRGTLREKMRTSALCDGPAMAARFGAALRELWREACGAGDGA